MKWAMMTMDPVKLELARRWAPSGWEPWPFNRYAPWHQHIDGVHYFDMDSLARSLPPRFMRYYNHPKPGYALGAKQLIPLMLKGDFLFSDDDVFFVQHPQPLIEMGTFGEGYGFDKWDNSWQSLKRCDALSDIFETEISHSLYNMTNLSNGVWYADEFPDWERLLHRFWAHTFTDDISYEGNVFRVLDITFVRCYAILHDWYVCNSTDERRVYNRAPMVTKPTREKIMKGYWVHYCCKQYKQEYIRVFTEMLSC